MSLCVGNPLRTLQDSAPLACPVSWLLFLWVPVEGLVPHGAALPVLGAPAHRPPLTAPLFRGSTLSLCPLYSTAAHVSPWFQFPRGHGVPRPGPLPPQRHETTGLILQGQRTMTKRGKCLGSIPSSSTPHLWALGKWPPASEPQCAHLCNGDAHGTHLADCCGGHGSCRLKVVSPKA